MTNFLKLAARMSGANYARLAASTDKSKTKVIALSMAMLAPVIVWTSSSFMFSYSIMENSFMISALIALVAGLLIFIIERLVLMSNGNRLATVFRIMLAAGAAWLGAVFIDQAIFKEDIEHSMPALQHQEALKAQEMAAQQFNERHELAALDSAVKANYQEFTGRQDEAIQEAAGLSGSHRKGAASATHFKQAVANKSFAQYNLHKAQQDSLLATSARLQGAAYDSASARFNHRSILFRVKAMQMLLNEHSEMSGMYWAITFLFFMLEFLLIIFKLTWPKTAFELETDMLDELHQQRTSRMRSANLSMQRPHLVEPSLKAKSQQLGSQLNSLI